MHKYEIEERRRKVASLLGMPKNNTNTHITKILDERRQLENIDEQETKLKGETRLTTKQYNKIWNGEVLKKLRS